MSMHFSGGWKVGAGIVAMTAALATVMAAARSDDPVPGKPPAIPPEVAAKLGEYRAPDVAAAKLSALQAKMRPEYRFKIGRTTVLERPGGSLRGFRDGRTRPGQLKPPVPPERPGRPGAPGEGGGVIVASTFVPPAFDYVAKGVVTAVKSQWCSDCWAFAAAAICESSYIQKHPTEAWPDFSEQSLVDCVGYDCGCHGGYIDYAVDHVVRSGVMDEQTAPYAGRTGTCSTSQQQPAQGLTWGYVNTADPFGVADDLQLKLALLEHGPLAVGICWSELADAYVSGVLNNCAETSGPADHAVVLVGWDDDRKAWRIKNSEGSGWGEGGFAWVEYGCASIGTMAVWVEMQ